MGILLVSVIIWVLADIGYRSLESEYVQSKEGEMLELIEVAGALAACSRPHQASSFPREWIMAESLSALEMSRSAASNGEHRTAALLTVVRTWLAAQERQDRWSAEVDLAAECAALGPILTETE